MKLNPDITLQKIGSMSILVNVAGAGGQDLTEVYNLNDTAAFLWEKIGTADIDVNLMSQWLCDEYDVTPEQAEKDCKYLLGQWEQMGLTMK